MSRFVPRDASWLAAERDRISAWPRADLVEWLSWADSNGDYRDLRASREEFADAVMLHVEDTMETPEEMRVAWARERY